MNLQDTSECEASDTGTDDGNVWSRHFFYSWEIVREEV